MTTTETTRSWWSEHAELGVAGLLAAVGLLVAADTVVEGTLPPGRTRTRSDPASSRWC